MAKYEIVYDVEIDTEDPYEAVFWLQRVIRNPELELPDHVYWVRTVPKVTDVTEAPVPPKATPSTTKPKAKPKDAE